MVLYWHTGHSYSLDPYKSSFIIFIFSPVYIMGQWFWSPDVWHKNLEGRWNSKILCKKPFSPILSGCLHYWTFLFIKSTHWPYYETKTYFLWLGQMEYQKIRLFILISKYDPSKKCIFVQNLKFCLSNIIKLANIIILLRILDLEMLKLPSCELEQCGVWGWDPSSCKIHRSWFNSWGFKPQ